MPVTDEAANDSILLLGNYRPALSVARALSNSGYTVIMGVGDRGEGFTEYSRAVSERWHHPCVERSPEIFTKRLMDFLKRRTDIKFVYPVAEEFVDYFSKHTFERLGQAVVVSPAPDVVATCRDKVALLDLAENLKVQNPDYRIARSQRDLDRVAEGLGFPIIMRPLPPVKRIADKKAIIVTSSRELEDAKKHLDGLNTDLLVQKYVAGSRHDILFAACEGEITSAFQVAYMRTDASDGTGLCVHGRVVDLDAVLSGPTKKLVRALNYTGIGCAQFVIDDKTGTPCLIEINPRTSALHKVSEKLGLQFSELAVALASGTKPHPSHVVTKPEQTGQHFVWSYGEIRALKSAIRNGEVGVAGAFKRIFQILTSAIRADMHLTWSWRDPLPTLLLFADQLRTKRLRKSKEALDRNDLLSVSGPPISERDLRNLSWRRFENFEHLEKIWRTVEDVACATPFQNYDWLRAHFTTFDAGGKAKLAIVVGEDHLGHPVAVFPLCVRRRFGVNCLEWIGQDLNDYNCPLIAKEWLETTTSATVESVWQDVVASVGDVDLVYLCRQPVAYLGQDRPFSFYCSDVETSRAHALALGSDWASFSKKRFSKSTLRRLKEKSRKLSKLGAVSYTWHTDPAGRRTNATRILNWKCQQLAETGARNAFEDKRSIDFLKRAANACHDLLDVITLDLDGAPIAGIVMLKLDNSQIIYVMAYQPGPNTRMSPGMLLLHHVIEQAINQGHDTLDFSVGDEPYKIAMCNMHIEMRQTLKGFSTRGRVGAKALQNLLQIKRWAKGSDQVMSILQFGNRWRGKIKAVFSND